LAGAQLLPFERADFEAAIECSGIGVAASLRAFQRGFAAAASVGVTAMGPTGSGSRPISPQ